MPRPIFRLFISSTFADFRHEREALHSWVFPLLEAHCRARGARFDVVDLRWGISSEAQDDLQTLSICLTEVDRCRRIGLTPHFVALVGDRYGWEPAPVEIDAASWGRMTRGSSAIGGAIEEFYRIDRNSVPPIYALDREVYARADATQRRNLLDAVRHLARDAGMTRDSHASIFAAATHQEILRGMMARSEQVQGLAYLRSIEGLPLGREAAPYVDIVDDQFDADAHARVQGLKAEIRARLPETHVREVSATWAGDDVHTAYVEGFCARFLADHIELIDRSLAVATDEQSPDQAHAAFAEERARLFVGRQGPTRKILRYARIRQKANARGTTPLVIEGAGGAGKSALLAHAARRVRAENPEAIVITRFIGAVAGSEDLAAVLGDIAHAVAAAQGRRLPPSEAGVDVASAAFAAALATASFDRPICVFIDALDQLTNEDQLRLLDWLPDVLPLFAYVVLTTRPGPLMREARRRFPRTLMSVSPMSGGDSALMLDRLLADAGRRLTGAQRAKIRASSPGLPLWTRLAFEEARRWRSDEPGRRLERTVEGLIRARIAELSSPAKHGEDLVRDALGALVASRFGLSDSEIAQALSQSLAPQVWVAFRARSFHSWEQPVLPAILWLRLHADIAPYLVELRVDGALTYRFFHREFAEVVGAVVLQDNDRAAMHVRLAAVFSEPSGAEFYRVCDASGLQDSRALRRVMEQPWHLAEAGQDQELAALLDDLEFIAGKCAANRVADLMMDIAALEARRADAGASKSPSAAWRARLRAWRAMLEQGDAQWPAHRALFQLLLESAPDAQPQRARALATLQRTPPNWPVLLSVTPQDYVDPLAQDLPSRPNLVGMAPLAGGYLADWDAGGGLRIVNRRNAAVVERLELGSTRAARAHLSKLKQRFGTMQAVLEIRERRRADTPVGREIAEFGLQLSWQWEGCLSVQRGADRCEIVLGKGEIDLAGETATEVFFRCDDRVLVMAKARLAELVPGLYTYGGSRVAGLAIAGDAGLWTHERFNTVVFVDKDTCMTLGWSGLSGQREDVILEVYKVDRQGVRRVAYGVTDHDLDLPIEHICILSNGSVIFASERYWHTFVWAPPFDGACTVEMIPGARVGNSEFGNWAVDEDNGGALTFVPADVSSEVAIDAPGVYGKWGSECVVRDGISQILPDDHSAAPSFTGVETTSPDGALMRWHCDVLAHWIFARQEGDIIVFKNSGPVRLERWLG